MEKREGIFWQLDKGLKPYTGEVTLEMLQEASNYLYNMPKRIVQVKHKEGVWELIDNRGTLYTTGTLVATPKLLKTYQELVVGRVPTKNDLEQYKCLLVNYICRRVENVSLIKVGGLQLYPSKALVSELLSHKFSNIDTSDEQ